MHTFSCSITFLEKIRGEAAQKFWSQFLLILGQKVKLSEFKSHVFIKLSPFLFRIRLFEEGGLIEQEKVYKINI